jgi:hypothetical protein
MDVQWLGTSERKESASAPHTQTLDDTGDERCKSESANMTHTGSPNPTDNSQSAPTWTHLPVVPYKAPGHVVPW